MKQHEIEKALNQMQSLKCKRLFSMTRLGATGNICFVSLEDKKEYFLRIQTSFRVRTDHDILIANLDMFEPIKSLEESPSFDWDKFNWDVQGFNLYDEWTKKINIEYKEPLTVQNVIINNFGDLKIEFSQNIVLEVFINAASNECWRFFERTSKDDHLVVTGQGLEE